MSMRRDGLFGARFPHFSSDEAARYIQAHGQEIFHQRRTEETQCPQCWSEYGGTPSATCNDCQGTGYLVDKRRKNGLLSATQPFGNFGNATQSFKAGGRHIRESVYIYMDVETGEEVVEGDRFFIEFGQSFSQEYSIMNKQPTMLSSGVIGLWLFECASPINKNFGDTFQT